MSTSTHAHHPDPAEDPRDFWEGHYERQRERMQGNPNALALEQLEDLEVGSALELGSGQGADAIWLARAGWTVLAVELAETALRLADGRARDAGVSERIEWRRHDLASGVPEGAFDLVLSSYTQSPVALDRVEILRQAADRVAPGGALLILGHSGVPSWSTEDRHAEDMPDADTLVAQLDLPEDGWIVDRRLDVERAITAPDAVAAVTPR